MASVSTVTSRVSFHFIVCPYSLRLVATNLGKLNNIGNTHQDENSKNTTTNNTYDGEATRNSNIALLSIVLTHLRSLYRSRMTGLQLVFRDDSEGPEVQVEDITETTCRPLNLWQWRSVLPMCYYP